jgi:hypothetical protein
MPPLLIICIITQHGPNVNRDGRLIVPFGPRQARKQRAGMLRIRIIRLAADWGGKETNEAGILASLWRRGMV